MTTDHTLWDKYRNLISDGKQVLALESSTQIGYLPQEVTMASRCLDGFVCISPFLAWTSTLTVD